MYSKCLFLGSYKLFDYKAKIRVRVVKTDVNRKIFSVNFFPFIPREALNIVWTMEQDCPGLFITPTYYLCTLTNNAGHLGFLIFQEGMKIVPA